MSIFNSPTAQNWTSMSYLAVPCTAYQMDLNVHFWRSHRVLSGPQCSFLAVPPRIKSTSKSISGGSNRTLLDLNVHIWSSHRILWTSMSIIELDTFLAGAQGAAVSQELWISGGALFQRVQEPNIPCGESLTSINPALQTLVCHLTSAW